MAKRRGSSARAGEGYAFPDLLAETDWLAPHLDDPKVRVVDMDVSEAYRRAHIPGAVTVSVDHYLKDPKNNIHVMPPAAFKALMESLGVGDDTLVVSYDNSRGVYAARLWWALQYYGHTQARLLNGGWRKWFAEGRPTTQEATEVSPGVTFTPRTDKSLIVSTQELKGTYDSPDVVVWDVRSRGEFTGENPRQNRRAGHIPSAVHMEWLDAVDPETHTLKPAHELRAMLAERGITPEKEVVIH